MTPLFFNSTADGILLSFALHMKHIILKGINLSQANGPLLTIYPANSIRSRNRQTKNLPSLTKLETQHQYVEFHDTISLGSTLYCV